MPKIKNRPPRHAHKDYLEGIEYVMLIRCLPEHLRRMIAEYHKGIVREIFNQFANSYKEE